MDCISTSSLSRFNHGDAPARLPGSQWTHAGGIKIQRSPEVWRNICSTLWHQQPPTQGWWKNNIYDPVIQKVPASCNFHMAESWSHWLKRRNLQETAVFFLQILVGKWPCAHTSANVSLEIVTSARDDRLPTNFQWLKKINPQTFKQVDRHLTVKIQKCPKKTLEVLLLPWEKKTAKIRFPDPTAWAMTAVPSPCSATLPSMLLRLRHRLPPARNGPKTLRSSGSP